MAWSIGSFTFPTEDEPYDAEVPGARGRDWVRINPVGYDGTILQLTRGKDREFTLRVMLSDDSKADLNTIWLAGAEVEFVHPREPGGITVVMTQFSPEWHAGIPPGADWWDTVIELVER